VLKKGSDPLDVESNIPVLCCLAYPAMRRSDPFFNTLLRPSMARKEAWFKAR
jgi:hypothetical protein